MRAVLYDEAAVRSYYMLLVAGCLLLALQYIDY